MQKYSRIIQEIENPLAERDAFKKEHYAGECDRKRAATYSNI